MAKDGEGIGRVYRWYIDLHPLVQAIIAGAGSVIVGWARTLPAPFDAVVGWSASAVVVLAIFLIVLHAIRGLRGGRSVTPFDVISTGLVGVVLSAGILTAGLIWQGSSATTAPDYSYALSYQGVGLGFDPNNADAALQISISLMNVSRSALVYRVTDMRVVVNNRTISTPIYMNNGGIIPSATTRQYRYPPFNRDTISDFIGKIVQGTVVYTVEYGAPNLPAVRRLTMTLNITLNLGSNPGIGDIIAAENEQAI